MFNKDYIMRMIELLVQGIAKIMHLKQENRIEESETLFTDTLRKFYGLNDKSVEELPWTDLMSVASLGGLQDAEKCAFLAQLIKEKADLEQIQGRTAAAQALYAKALNIYISALLADGYYNIPEHRDRIDEIIGLIAQQVPTIETLQMLFRYYELAGRYGKAEDMLYALLDAGADREETVEAGRTFYMRLLQRSDIELMEGNLPREEVREGLGEMK
jgi:hypothetical protein